MTETSGGPELSDSLSSGGIVTQPPLRKVKSRVRVRRASISEPSDTDPEPRTLEPSPAEWFVQQHRELELLNSFRERFGCDWLQYRSHLETSGSPVPAASRTAALSTPPLDSPDPETLSSTLPSLPPAEKGATSPEESPPEMSEEGRLGAEPQEEEEGAEQEEEEEAKEEEEQAQKEVAVELCRPMLVCPLQGPEGVRGRECFLRVTAAHLFEVELQAARTLERLELQCLEAAEVEPETPSQQEPEPEGSGLPPGAPVLVLHFSYICPDRRLRRYAVLEPDAHVAAQELLAVLSPVAGRAQKQLGEARDLRGGRFQCLRCGREFKPHSEEGWRPLFRMTESPAVCPHCGSDHVVLLALSGTTPTWEQEQGEPSPVPSQSLSPVCDPSGHGDHLDGADGVPPQAPISHTRSSWSLSPPLERCGLRSVDHRLRLFLDVEVFGDAQEEFQCCVKVPVVLAGHTEFPCLVVVSDHRLYLLKVTGEIRGPPAGWLQPTLAIPLQDLSDLELGLAGQSLRLEWAAGAGGCVLLPRDARRCRVFLEELMGETGERPGVGLRCPGLAPCDGDSDSGACTSF